jgi:RecA/RadA recombinase
MKPRSRKLAAHARQVTRRAAKQASKRKPLPTARNQRVKGHTQPLAFAQKLGVIDRVRVGNLTKYVLELFGEEGSKAA